MLKCRVLGGKPGPFPMGPVVNVVRTGTTVQIRVEPTREFGPFANTQWRRQPQILQPMSAKCIIVTGSLQDCVRGCGV